MNLLVLGVFDRVLLERFVRLGLLTNIVSQRRKRRASETEIVSEWLQRRLKIIVIRFLEELLQVRRG